MKARQTLRKQAAKVGIIKGKTGVMLKNLRYEDETYVEERKPDPILNYIKQSSLCIFHKKSRIRRAIFKIVIDPEFDYPSEEVKKVDFKDL